MESKTIISAQVAIPVRDELARLAEAADRSLSGEIRRALAEHLARELERAKQQEGGL